MLKLQVGFCEAVEGGAVFCEVMVECSERGVVWTELDAIDILEI